MRRIFLILAAALFVTAGLFHFLFPAGYLKIMPPYVPWHLAMVDISGACEIAGGLGLLFPTTRRAAAWGLVALLVAVFPANVYMATNPAQAGASAIAAWIRWGRLPLQLVLIAWVLWCSKPPRTALNAPG